MWEWYEKYEIIVKASSVNSAAKHFLELINLFNGLHMSSFITIAISWNMLTLFNFDLVTPVGSLVAT